MENFYVICIFITLLSIFVTVWNYVTKCDFLNGKYVKVYSLIGFILRLLVSLIPIPMNFLMFLFVFTEPISDDWLDVKTKDDCLRVKIMKKLNKHTIIE